MGKRVALLEGVGGAIVQQSGAMLARANTSRWQRPSIHRTLSYLHIYCTNLISYLLNLEII